jgi:uncharacterized protein with HEPN domain
MSRNPLLYLQELLDGIRAILSYVEGMTEEEFVRDEKTLDACIRRFQIVGEAAKKMPAKWKEDESKIPWKDVINFRNLLVHEYFRIDETLLWNTIGQDLEPLLAACERIQKRLEKETDD